MLVVSGFCDHLKDLNILTEACDKVEFISISDEARLGFLKEYSSIFPGNMTKMELAFMDMPITDKYFLNLNVTLIYIYPLLYPPDYRCLSLCPKV